jgi:hypothetical protein
MQLQFQFVIGFYETFLADGKFKGLSKFQQAITCKILTLFTKVMTFLFLLSNEGLPSATAMATESAQNCQILPKSAQRQLA